MLLPVCLFLGGETQPFDFKYTTLCDWLSSKYNQEETAFSKIP